MGIRLAPHLSSVGHAACRYSHKGQNLRFAGSNRELVLHCYVVWMRHIQPIGSFWARLKNEVRLSIQFYWTNHWKWPLVICTQFYLSFSRRHQAEFEVEALSSKSNCDKVTHGYPWLSKTFLPRIEFCQRGGGGSSHPQRAKSCFWIIMTSLGMFFGDSSLLTTHLD